MRCAVMSMICMIMHIVARVAPGESRYYSFFSFDWIDAHIFVSSEKVPPGAGVNKSLSSGAYKRYTFTGEIFTVNAEYKRTPASFFKVVYDTALRPVKAVNETGSMQWNFFYNAHSPEGYTETGTFPSGKTGYNPVRVEFFRDKKPEYILEYIYTNGKINSVLRKNALNALESAAFYFYQDNSIAVMLVEPMGTISRTIFRKHDKGKIFEKSLIISMRGGFFAKGKDLSVITASEIFRDDAKQYISNTYDACTGYDYESISLFEGVRVVKRIEEKGALPIVRFAHDGILVYQANLKKKHAAEPPEYSSNQTTSPVYPFKVLFYDRLGGGSFWSDYSIERFDFEDPHLVITENYSDGLLQNRKFSGRGGAAGNQEFIYYPHGGLFKMIVSTENAIVLRKVFHPADNARPPRINN